MTSAVAMGMTTDVTNMSRYPSLWVIDVYKRQLYGIWNLGSVGP